MAKLKRKTVWIDLDNSPHVPFFKPIIKELERNNINVVITIRKNAQTVELADFHHIKYRKIGAHYGKNKLIKIAGTIYRSLQLLPYIITIRPNLAVAHGSRAMIIVSKILRIPSLGIGDYEHAKGFIKTSWQMIPEVIPKSAVHPVPPERVLTYPGIKEDVYVPSFNPDPKILDDFNIPKGNVIITIRPPAVDAHYHNPESDILFKTVIDFFSSKKNVSMIILPRYSKQVIEISKQYQELIKNKSITIPDKVYDGLNLIWFSDLVVSGGGTMNREAAALGVPVYSIFRGKIGAVDNYLSHSGRLVLLESVDDVRNKIKVEKRNRTKLSEKNTNETLNTIVRAIIKILGE